MKTKTFEVTLSTSDYDSGLLATSRMRELILGFFAGTAVTVVTVTRPRPPGVSKIQAIKELRQRFDLRLLDAKLLVDLAAERGEVCWGNTIISTDRHADPAEQFIVSNADDR